MDRNPDANLPAEEKFDGGRISRKVCELGKREIRNLSSLRFNWLENKNPSRVSFSALLFLLALPPVGNEEINFVE